MATYQDVLENTKGLISETSAEVSALDAAIAELRAAREATRQAWAKARAELAAVYLADLTPEWIAACERRSGFRGFSRFDPIKAKQKEVARLTADIAHIRADEKYTRREYLIGPVGEITRRLEEAKSLLDPWERECATFESLPGFTDLVACGYDTPDYPNRWWEPIYWRRWSQGDAICDALGMNDFGDDVLPAYQKVEVERRKWRAQVSGVEAEFEAVRALVQRHDDDVARLANLDAIYLGEAQQAVAAYLEGVDEPLLESWSEGDRGIQSLLRTCAGLKAKASYHEQLATTLQQGRDDLQTRLTGYNTKLAKLNRPKAPYKPYSDRDVSRKGWMVVEKNRTRRAKALALRDRFDRYDDYDAFPLTNDPALWWMAMSGRAPGAWHPGLNDWYARHPDVVVVIDEDFDDDDPPLHPGVAAAVADHDLDALGDVS